MAGYHVVSHIQVLHCSDGIGDGMLGVYLIIAFCVAILVAFITVMLTRGRDLDEKKPKVLSMDNLQCGRYIKRRKSNLEEGKIDVLIRPDNSFLWKTHWIKGIKEDDFVFVDSPDADEPGVSKSGYYVIKRGKDGDRRIIDKLGISIEDKTETLRDKIKRLKIENRRSKDTIRKKDEDIKTQMGDLSELHKILNPGVKNHGFPRKKGGLSYE